MYIINYIKILIEKSSEMSCFVGKNIGYFFDSYLENKLKINLSFERTKAIKFYLKLIDFIKKDSIKKNK